MRITLATWFLSLVFVAIGEFALLVKPRFPEPGSRLERYWVESNIVHGIKAEDLRRLTLFAYRFGGILLILLGITLPWFKR